MLKYTNITRVRGILILTCMLFSTLVKGQPQVNFSDSVSYSEDIITGVERTNEYLSLLKGQSVALVGNHTSVAGDQHTVDFLLANGIALKKVFAPEHGFRGRQDAGAKIKDGVDEKTGLPILSLHGRSKKPGADALADVDVVIFDIQDVGARFYTYISTMHYVMEACAEQGKKFLVFDRPNPNGHYVDGPVLKMENKSFVGMHPVPVVHGMTVGEYAQMINGEGWLKNQVKCDLTVVKCANYSHSDFYKLPVKPSPNLPNMSSIYLYPSLCLFEGTQVSIGRGTDKQFQLVGSPFNKGGDYNFTPEPKPGASKPKHQGKECNGYDLSEFGARHMREQRVLYLKWLIEFYQNSTDKEHFFRTDGFFRLLTGDREIRKMIEAGKTADEIAATWQEGVQDFLVVRKKYLLYEDFDK